MKPVYLGIDIGGTASRWVACDDNGAEIARGRASGATGHLFNPTEKARLAAALTAIAADLAASGLAPRAVTAGITGYGAIVMADMEALLGDTFGLSGEAIVATDDIVMAYLANYAPGQGHLISAGTGSIGVFIGADQGFVRVGGRGILIDDAGSGSWIALNALDRLYRVIDAEGPVGDDNILARHLFAAIGGSQWQDVRQFVYGGDRGRIGMLAMAVANAATEHDPTALAILRQAGAELARLAAALIARVGPRPIGFVGGVLKLHPLILQRIVEDLPGSQVSLLEADTALAAARLPAHGDPRWKPLLQTRASIG